jgi:hypothetical protein
MKYNIICIFCRVSEALIYGAWMLGQGLAFVPNFSIAKLAAGRMFHIMDRKPQIYSPQMMGSCAWVSYIYSAVTIPAVTVKCPLLFLDLRYTLFKIKFQ